MPCIANEAPELDEEHPDLHKRSRRGRWQSGPGAALVWQSLNCSAVLDLACNSGCAGELPASVPRCPCSQARVYQDTCGMPLTSVTFKRLPKMHKKSKASKLAYEEDLAGKPFR